MLNSDLLILEYTETFDQSDDKIWPDQQKDKHKNRDKAKFAYYNDPIAFAILTIQIDLQA